VTQIYSLAHFRVKLHSNWCGGARTKTKGCLNRGFQNRGLNWKESHYKGLHLENVLHLKLFPIAYLKSL